MTTEPGMERRYPSPPGRAGPAPSETSHEHRLAETAAMPGAPVWLGHLVEGSLCHEVDRGSEAAGRREEFRRVARLLGSAITDVEADLAAVRTGRLLRVLVETEAESALCFSPVPGERIVGFAVDAEGTGEPPDPAAADRDMIGLVDRLRTDVGMLTENPGGPTVHRATARTGMLYPTDEPLIERTGDLRRTARVEQWLGPRTLHWIAGSDQREVTFAVDIFDDPRLEPYFGRRIAPEERRAYYGGFAARAGLLVRRFNRLLRDVLGSPLRRLVLNVEQGVVVIQRRNPADHLVGVTLRQDDVAAAETAMRDISRDVLPALR